MKSQTKHFALIMKNQTTRKMEDTQKAYAEMEHKKFPSEIKPFGNPAAIREAQLRNRSVADQKRPLSLRNAEKQVDTGML